MIRVIIADDHQVMLDGIESILQYEEEYEVVATCKNGAQVIHRLADTGTDILLLDINMPRMNGIAVMEEILVKFPDVKVIALSMYKQPSYVNRMMKLGAMGYILKDEGKEVILEALQTVVQGQKFLSKNVAEIIRNQNRSEQVNPGITSREKQVLELLGKGMTSPEIAEKLFISFHTVKSHRKHLLRKFQVKNVSALLSVAKDRGII